MWHLINNKLDEFEIFLDISAASFRELESGFIFSYYQSYNESMATILQNHLHQSPNIEQHWKSEEV